MASCVSFLGEVQDAPRIPAVALEKAAGELAGLLAGWQELELESLKIPILLYLYAIFAYILD